MLGIRNYSAGLIALPLLFGLSGCETPVYKERSIEIVVRGIVTPAPTAKPTKVQRRRRNTVVNISTPTPPPVSQKHLIQREYNQTLAMLKGMSLSAEKKVEMRDRMDAIPRLLEDEKYALADETLRFIREELQELKATPKATPTVEIEAEVVVVGTPVVEPMEPEVAVTPTVVETTVPSSPTSAEPPAKEVTP